MAQVTKELAERILGKLGAKKTGKKGAAHIEYSIEHRGQVIAVTNLRPGSSKELGHDHMPRDLHVATGFAKKIGQCSKYRKDYIKQLQDDGLIDTSDDEGDQDGGTAE